MGTICGAMLLAIWPLEQQMRVDAPKTLRSQQTIGRSQSKLVSQPWGAAEASRPKKSRASPPRVARSPGVRSCGIGVGERRLVSGVSGVRGDFGVKRLRREEPRRKGARVREGR